MKYDIQCKTCQHVEERNLPFGQIDNLDPCVECGSCKVHVIILTAPETIYKGKDWFCKSGSYSHRKKVTKEDIDIYDNTNKVKFTEADYTVETKR